VSACLAALTLAGLCLLCVICFSFVAFFSSSSGPHRDLHSFPTRRSSDLWPCDPSLLLPLHRRLPGAARQNTLATPEGNHVMKTRSEEHTSELQSRENLVCRLLLEKKKHNSAALRLDHLTG